VRGGKRAVTDVLMLLEHDGRRPLIAADAYIAPTAVLCGDVTIAAGCRVLFGAVLTAEDGPVMVGEGCVVMEHAVVRGRSAHPARLGARVLVGPHAHVNGADVEDEAFIATGAALFPGARIGARAEIRINGVVHVNSTLPDEAVVPIGWVAVGDPARILPPSAHDEIWEIQQELGFVRTVAGVHDHQRDASGSAMPALMRTYGDLYGRHRDDRPLEP
jgi:carbonic anhydrase/acetyltransferase-like protein (isoleucine patch superfamily)